MNHESVTAHARRYRVFVSYSHEDHERFDQLRGILESLDLCVLSDRDIGAGTPFTDAIKGLITHAHLFVPLISKAARDRPWVHQETGFAMARNIPVLPVVLEDAGMPTEMVAQLQAIKVRTDLSDLAERLRETALEALIFPRPAPPTEMVMIAEWPEERTQLLAECANRVRDLGFAGMFRQHGALSSFCIPDADISDATWARRERDAPRGEYYRHLQREERRALEWHALRAGCRLIIDPSLRLDNRPVDATVSRLQTLLAFLESARDSRVEVVISSRARVGNLTLVGDWFVAESRVPRPGGYQQTIFNWHAPSVSRWVQRFDRQFEDLCREQGLEPDRSREVAVEEIARNIRECEGRAGADPARTPG